MDDPWADTAGDIGASEPPKASPRVSSESAHASASSSRHDPTAAKDDELPSEDWGGQEGGGVAEDDSAFASGSTSPVVESERVVEADELPRRSEDVATAPAEADEPPDAEERVDVAGEEEGVERPSTPPALEESATPLDEPASPQDDFGDDDEPTFDDFDDFDAPQAPQDDFDDFGDFGDFAEGDEGETPAVEREVEFEALGERLTALSLRPVPARRELQERLETVLAPLVPSDEGFNDKPPRAVGGLAQVLVTESSREAYAQLTTAPILKPLDWTRSRVRREHLIAMGVPVNLDEVDSHRLTALPPLQIRTGMSARSSQDRRQTMPASTSSASAPVSALPRPPTDKYGLGTRPEFDVPTAERLCAMEDGEIALMSLEKLQRIQEELVGVSADASAQLAWLLQYKDALGQDAATCNGMISELIANAAKTKQPSSGLWSGRRSRPTSMSAANTPRRVASPGAF